LNLTALTVTPFGRVSGSTTSSATWRLTMLFGLTPNLMPASVTKTTRFPERATLPLLRSRRR
jgi:hypothetical protein